MVDNFHIRAEYGSMSDPWAQYDPLSGLHGTHLPTYSSRWAHLDPYWACMDPSGHILNSRDIPIEVILHPNERASELAGLSS